MRAGAIHGFHSESAEKLYALYGSITGSKRSHGDKGVAHPKVLRIPIGVHVRPVLVLR